MRLPNNCELCGESNPTVFEFVADFSFGRLRADLCKSCHDLSKEHIFLEILKHRAEVRNMKLPIPREEMKKLL